MTDANPPAKPADAAADPKTDTEAKQPVSAKAASNAKWAKIGVGAAIGSAAIAAALLYANRPSRTDKK